MVLVSVIMGSYNYSAYIGEAIESVLNQTFTDIELIIVDDCSQDNSRSIIDEYASRDNRIKSSHHSSNMGISRTLNDCLKQVTGRYVCLIDADDVWDKHKLEKQLTVLSANEGKLVWSEALIIDETGQPTGGTVTQLLCSRRTGGDLFEDLLCEQYVYIQSLICEAKFLVGSDRDENLRYVNDHRFIADLSKNHEFVFMDEPLVKYRLHSSNITKKDKTGWMQDRITVRKYFLEKYSDIISSKTRADIYYKMGHAYANLGCRGVAQKYFIKAFSEDYRHLNSALYLALAVTARNQLFNELSARCYYAALSYFFRLLDQIRKTI